MLFFEHVVCTCTHILFSIGDLLHLHENLFCPEMLSSPIAVVACGMVNSLCNAQLKADTGVLKGELFPCGSVSCAITLAR